MTKTARLRCIVPFCRRMCDALCEKIQRDNTVRGRVTKRGIELAAIAKLAGDLIAAMREEINPNSPDGRPLVSSSENPMTKRQDQIVRPDRRIAKGARLATIF